MDDSPFTNEWFAPAYVEYFFNLPPSRRKELLEEQYLASYGVSQSLLQEIYASLYELDTLSPGRLTHNLLVRRRAIDLKQDAGRIVVVVHCRDTGDVETYSADVAVCCTGYRSAFPDYLEPLRERVSMTEQGFQLNRDYSVVWDGPPGLRIFAQNAAEHTHGIADPNLSLMVWRSACIINALCGRQVYHTTTDATTIAWHGGGS